MTDTERALTLFENGDYTCVLCKGESTFTSTERGVKPLLDFLKSENSLAGYSAADKVVGKGAAFLYVLLGVSEVYADVISKQALRVLTDNGIGVVYIELVDSIMNRKGDGFCPIETSVMNTENPKEALVLIKEKLKAMKVI